MFDVYILIIDRGSVKLLSLHRQTFYSIIQISLRVKFLRIMNIYRSFSYFYFRQKKKKKNA